jgi:hypothetical protein
MKNILLIISILIIASSCGSRKGFLERTDSDKSLQDAVKKLKKSPNDEDARAAIPQLYKIIKQKHLDKINAYHAYQQIGKWDVLITEYEYLQMAYDAIINSSEAFKLVTPESYAVNIFTTKDSAALAFYNMGNLYLDKIGRDNAKTSYNNFYKSNQYAPNFKDANEKMKIAYNHAMINLVINPFDETAVYYQASWRAYNFSNRNDYFEQNLINDVSNNNSAVKIFGFVDSKRLNAKPDWTIDLRMKKLDFPNPVVTNASKNVSRQIKIGTDTSGKPVYNTVNATIYTNRSKFNAVAELEMSINNLIENKNIDTKTYRQSYEWYQDMVTFSGDKRAISNTDWDLINNSGANDPRKDEIVDELYKKLYTRVLNGVKQAISW